MTKVVARPWLNPEKDSDGMACAESAEGWRRIPFFCYAVERSYHNCTKKTQSQLEQSYQVHDTRYAKNVKPTPEVRPYLPASVMES